jgi:hypothetical protein
MRMSFCGGMSVNRNLDLSGAAHARSLAQAFACSRYFLSSRCSAVAHERRYRPSSASRGGRLPALLAAQAELSKR